MLSKWRDTNTQQTGALTTESPRWVTHLNKYICIFFLLVEIRSGFIQLNISPEIILTLRSNIDLRRLQILPHHLDALHYPNKVVLDMQCKLFISNYGYRRIHWVLLFNNIGRPEAKITGHLTFEQILATILGFTFLSGDSTAFC